MSGAGFDVATGETVTAFALGPLEAWEFHGPSEPMEDRVDYRFVNGWVDVGDLPCRRATWEEVRTRPVPPMPQITGDTVNLPGFSRRLDFSGFWHVPHRLVRAARVQLIPPQGGDLPFRIGTCGGVHIWVDGVHIAGVEPFTRNAMQETEITLPLREGGSDVVIRLEDMAERDTTFFLELTWLGQGTLVSEVPSQADPAALAALVNLAREVRPVRVVFGAGEALTLNFDTAPDTDVSIHADVPRSVHLRHLPPLWQGEGHLRAGDTSLSFGMPDLASGYHPLNLLFRVGETLLRRSIAFALLREPISQIGPDLNARKHAALAHAAAHGEHRIGTVLARMALGRDWSKEDGAILDLTLRGIDTRRDCSDFEMVPLLWLLTRCRDQLPSDKQAAAEASVLGYRYWMTDPGNDAMWFWSENHVLCFHTSEYLAGRLFPEAVFDASGRTGAAHAALAETRLHRWFDAIERDGLAEWNSAAYYPIDFIGLLALAALGDGTIRLRARHLLDRLFTMIALHTMGGTCAGSMGRAYDKELRAGPLSELSPFAAVAFGAGWLNSGVAALPMFCIGDYAPPAALGALAAPQGAVEARYVQGHGDQGRLGLWKTAHGMLSAAVDGAPGAHGHQQHLVDAQFASPFARVWINHPGEDDPWGSARPSYWAGNGVMPRMGMYRDTVLVLSDVGSGRLPFTHVYAPGSEFDAMARGENWMVLQSGAGALILKATGVIEPVTVGPGAGLEWRQYGQRTGWAMILCQMPPDGLKTLEQQAKALTLVLNETLRLRGAGRPDLSLSCGEGLHVDHVLHPFPTTARDPQINHYHLKETSCG